MRSRPVPVLVPALLLATASPLLASCGLLGLGGDALDDALDVGADAYLEAVVDDPAEAPGSTELVRYLGVMDEKAELDERDVEWAVSGTTEDSPFTVYRLDDDADLDAFADDLEEAGFTEDEVRGRRHLVGNRSEVASIDGLVADAYPVDFLEVAVDADDHLLVTGSGFEGVLSTIDGDTDSIAEADTFDAVLDGSDDVESASLADEAVCVRANEVAGLRATPEQLEEIDQQLADDLRDLAAPERTAYLHEGDDLAQSVRLEFADDDTAEQDLAARRTYLEDGLLATTRTPFSDLGTADLERDGSVVVVDLDLDDPADGQALARGDGPLACRT